MNELTFNGISESDMKYIDYLAKHRFRDFTSLSLETDLSAEHRIKKLENQGYIIFDKGELCFSFNTVIALTDYRNYLIEQKKKSQEKTLSGIGYPFLLTSYYLPLQLSHLLLRY